MKRLLPVLAIALLMSACNPSDPSDPAENEDIHFSVLGDSFSAFTGTVDPDSNDVWEYENVGVTQAEQMWWYKVATKMEWVMDKNNSFSGALISNFYDFDGGPYYGPHSYLRRMDNLGNPDVIFVFGGTNDVWDGAQFGDFVYSDWTEQQLCDIRPAIAYLFDNLGRLYPNAEVYFLIDMDLCSSGADEETKQQFKESSHRIATHYPHVKCIDIYDIHKSWWHPDAQGQEDIARQVIEALSIDFNV